MDKFVSSGGIVINKKDQILIVNQGGRSWSFPKGHVEKGEDLFTAAKREIYEESGIKDLIYIRDLGSFERYRIGLDGKDDTSKLKEIHLFLFSTEEEKLQPQDPDNPEARWVDKDEVENLLTHNKDKNFFSKIRNSI